MLIALSIFVVNDRRLAVKFFLINSSKPGSYIGEIKKLKPGRGGEIHITDAIRSLIKKESKFYGNIFTGKYLDCGTLSGYINSGIQIFKGK